MLLRPAKSRIAVIGSTKMLRDRSMSASGKLHRGDATQGQWPEWAVLD
ncbi:hypothetical protein [Litoreibacter halocynthiae]|nr:hypothetical protein [Litoreibacter halocynthiae]